MRKIAANRNYRLVKIAPMKAVDVQLGPKPGTTQYAVELVEEFDKKLNGIINSINQMKNDLASVKSSMVAS